MPARGIFTKPDGQPIVFYLHKTIAGDTRIILRDEIQSNGGQVTDDDDEAETVLIDDYALHTTVLQLRYAMRPVNPRVHNFWVEPLSFVRKCINWGYYSHEARKIGMPGRSGNEEGLFRVPFTPADDDHLVQFIATHLPDKSAGGRLGYEPYRRLVSMYDEHDPETFAFKWVRRHTYQSWHERYRKNQARLDPLIDAIALRENPPDAVTYERNRQYSRGYPKHIYARQEEEEEEEEEPEEEPRTASDELSPIPVQEVAQKTVQDQEGYGDERQAQRAEYEEYALRVAGQKRRHSEGSALVAQHLARRSKRPRLATTSSQDKDKQRASTPEDEDRPPSPTLVNRLSPVYPPLPVSTPPEGSPRNSASPEPNEVDVPEVAHGSPRPPSPTIAQPSRTSRASVVHKAPSQHVSAAQTRVRRRAPAVVPVDAPARNTRGRSREPTVEPPPAPVTRRRRGRRVSSSSPPEDNAEPMDAVLEEDEAVAAVQEGPEVQPEPRSGIVRAETQNDEAAVEYELMQASTGTTAGGEAYAGQAEDEADDEEEEDRRYEGDEEDEEVEDDGYDDEESFEDGEDLSDDDAQTRENISLHLPEPPISAPAAISTGFVIPKPPLEVRRLARGTQPNSNRATLPHTPAPANTTQSTDNSLSNRTPWPADLLPSLSVLRQSSQRRRGMSTDSSVESWPLKNTRASTVKQRLTQEQMLSPYIPAEGTKASRLRAQARAR
ncbi:hypothetical protein BD626DRAFT_633841 [Schizophyllum amplum]|uniref:BRCT domain-containing protein n=1 Tax=Schizophyllum amplum TaxID=97359 RepID=A0A550C189_9AGAR|nr:hypothetical protein BD626DRAFT_633841 [Auriculariopsis ampla]